MDLVAACELVFPDMPGSATQAVRREVALFLAKHERNGEHCQSIQTPAVQSYRRLRLPSDPPKVLDVLRADTQFFFVAARSSTFVILNRGAVLAAAVVASAEKAATAHHSSPSPALVSQHSTVMPAAAGVATTIPSAQPAPVATPAAGSGLWSIPAPPPLPAAATAALTPTTASHHIPAPPTLAPPPPRALPPPPPIVRSSGVRNDVLGARVEDINVQRGETAGQQDMQDVASLLAVLPERCVGCACATCSSMPSH
jgi:hypothetical protein